MILANEEELLVEDDVVGLVDTGRSKKVSKSRLEKTAMNHFNKFLVYSNNEYNQFDLIPERGGHGGFNSWIFRRLSA